MFRITRKVRHFSGISSSNALVCTLSFLYILPFVLTDNYLIVFGFESGSHMITMTSAAEAMIERNHNVTLVMARGFDNSIRKAMPNKTYTAETYESSIPLESCREYQTKWSELALNGRHFEMIRFGSNVFPALFQSFCEDIFNDKELLKRLESGNFDLMFAHTIFACPILVAQHLNIRFVTITPAIPPSVHIRLYRNPVNPAYNPELLTGFSDRMTFPERLKNSLFSAIQWMLADISLRSFDNVKRKYNIKPGISTLESLAQAEIWFITSHFVLDFPRPYQPNTVSVGGITAKATKPLTKELEGFMQSSGDDGVIIFSMGSYVNAMDTSMADIFAEAFTKLPQKVIWKLAGQGPSSLPSNVKTSQWLPQNDLLGHSKTRVMIYHCGINGVFEAIHHAVPVICIAIQSDQWDNARRVEAKGIGLQLELSTLTSEALVEAIRSIIADESYQANMTRLSSIFHDEHLPAPQRVVYWMEKVARHRGADYLRTSAFELNAIQYNLLDVILFILTIVIIGAIIVTYFSILLCRFLLRCCIKNQKVKRE